MPSTKSSKSSKAEFTYNEGKLNKKHQPAVSESESEEEAAVSPPPKKSVKSVSKMAFQSDSEEEVAVKPTKSKHRAVASDDEEEPRQKMELIPVPPRKPKPAKTASKKESKKKESSKKKSSPVTPPKKSKKNSKKHVEESDTESEIDNDDALNTPEKLKAARNEMLTESEMKERTREEQENEYKRAKAFIKWYEKEYDIKKKKFESLPEWQKAVKLYTDAAANLIKSQGLQLAKIKPESQLHQAIPRLEESGREMFARAQTIIAGLNEEDLALFWEKQGRNKGVERYEDLITKKESDRRKLLEDVKREIEEDMKKRNEEEPAEDVEEDDE